MNAKQIAEDALREAEAFNNADQVMNDTGDSLYIGRERLALIIAAAVEANADASPELRRRLPNRRKASTFDFRVANGEYIATVGFYSDDETGGNMAELFLTAGKPGSTADWLAKDASLVLSLALQYSVPAAALHEALSRLPDGSPAGPLGMVMDEVMGGRPAKAAGTEGLDPQGLML